MFYIFRNICTTITMYIYAFADIGDLVFAGRNLRQERTFI